MHPSKQGHWMDSRVGCLSSCHGRKGWKGPFAFSAHADCRESGTAAGLIESVQEKLWHSTQSVSQRYLTHSNHTWVTVCLSVWLIDMGT